MNINLHAGYRSEKPMFELAGRICASAFSLFISDITL